MGGQQLNICANPALNGALPEGVFLNFDYTYDVVLTANQALADQSVAIHTDADFFWAALVLATATAAFRVRFADSSGYYLSSGYMNSAALLLGDIPFPFPIFHGLIFPAGGRIHVDIQDLSGAQNTIQLLFRGWKIYKTPRCQP